jgi:hypothetical protein
MDRVLDLLHQPTVRPDQINQAVSTVLTTLQVVDHHDDSTRKKSPDGGDDVGVDDRHRKAMGREQGLKLSATKRRSSTSTPEDKEEEEEEVKKQPSSSNKRPKTITNTESPTATKTA